VGPTIIHNLDTNSQVEEEETERVTASTFPNPDSGYRPQSEHEHML